MGEPVRAWVRWTLLVALAVPQLAIGVWGLLATRNWYENFPGVGPDLVAAIPPFNPHLASDAAGAFVATGVALLIAAIVPRRELVLMALATYLAFAAPHTLHHLTNEAPRLSSAEDLYNNVLLVAQVLLAVVLAWAAWRPATANGAPQEVPAT